MFSAPRAASVWMLCFCLLGSPGSLVRAQEKPLQNLPQADGALPLPTKSQIGFIMALARDERGDTWAGGEDGGVWRFDSTAHKWINYRVKDGLGDDNAYSIAVGKKGRVWVGHLNHGVSVWNGTQWQNYDTLNGPLGERVFAVATCPSDGDVWIATNAGLSRYSLSKDTWTYFTKANGLPSHEISALSFDSVGNVYLRANAFKIMRLEC